SRTAASRPAGRHGADRRGPAHRHRRHPRDQHRVASRAAAHPRHEPLDERSTVTNTSPELLASTYFQAWKGKDFDTLRKILADDVSFHGALGTCADAEECIAGLRGMAGVLDDIVIHKTFIDGDDVLTWYDLHTTGAPAMATANWMHIDNGRITAIR